MGRYLHRAKTNLRICVPFFLKVQTDQRFETQAKAQSPKRKSFRGRLFQEPCQEPPFLHVTTRRVAELHSERAQGALPAGPAASVGGAARKELLNAVQIVHGGHRIDKRNLPAEQGKGAQCTCGRAGQLCAPREAAPRLRAGMLTYLCTSRQ